MFDIWDFFTFIVKKKARQTKSGKGVHGAVFILFQEGQSWKKRRQNAIMIE